MGNTSNDSGVKIFAALLLIASLISICFDYLFPAANHTPLSLFLMNLSGSISIFPRGLPLLSHYFFPEFGLTAIIFWRICIILCGVGIFFYRNVARIFFIIFSAIHIIVFAFSNLLMKASHNSGTHYLSGNSIMDALVAFNYNFLVWLLPALYIIYFVLPKTRVQFK